MLNQDFERSIGFDFVRTTEAASLAAFPWIGRGEKELADDAACDAIRGMFDLMPIDGEIAIGEGIKDNAPGLFKGEKVGMQGDGYPKFDIALDPVDGTSNVGKGLPNAISCIAAALRAEGDTEPALLDVPAFYMNKLAYGQKVRDAFVKDPSLPLSVDADPEDTIKLVAKILDKNVTDMLVMVIDRPRNQYIIDAIRNLGASLRMITDGDITAALAPALPDSGVDLYMGIGGSPECVLSAAGMRCLGGGLQAKIWVIDEDERKFLIDEGWEDRIDQVFLSRDLARGKNILFTATGILDSSLLKGVIIKDRTAVTSSVLMRVNFGTVRHIETHHNLDKKTLRFRTQNAEVNFWDYSKNTVKTVIN